MYNEFNIPSCRLNIPLFHASICAKIPTLQTVREKLLLDMTKTPVKF
jgi:hypothetical protein